MEIEVCGVEKRFDGGVQALAEVNLKIPSGQFLCILGPSGCGKSTLLYTIAGLETTTKGEVFADGKPIQGTDPSRLLMFQDAALFPWLTVQGNVEFGMRGLPRAERAAQARKWLEMVKLQEFANKWAHQLSGGMRQRVALARALAVKPAALLLDEPFGALDAITRDLLHIELQEIWSKTKKTIIFVTHNVREAVVLGDRVIVMSARPGRIVADHTINLPRPRHIEDNQTATLAGEISADLRLH